MERRTLFPGRLLPALLIAPQLLLTFVFFLWPAAQAVIASTTRQNASAWRATMTLLPTFS